MRTISCNVPLLAILLALSPALGLANSSIAANELSFGRDETGADGNASRLASVTEIATEQNPIPEALREYIKELEVKTTFRDIPKMVEKKRPETITANQGMEDVEMIRYLFENAYSGKEYWEGKGIDFDGMYLALEEYAKSTEDVSVKEIQRIMHESLEGIRDGHLRIRGTEETWFYFHRDAYFSDVLLERNENQYVVISSGSEAVGEGSLYGGRVENLFPTLSPTGKQHFLLGALSYEYVPSLAAVFDGDSISVPLHPAGIGKARADGDDVFTFLTMDGVPVVGVNTFSVESDQRLRAYVECSKRLRKEKCFILDITGNSGGDSRYAQHFFENLNGIAQWPGVSAALSSPPIVQWLAGLDEKEWPAPMAKQMIEDARKELEEMRESPVRAWEIMRVSTEQAKGDYSGKAIALVNRTVASSGEMAAAFSRSVPDNVMIGENTAGIGLFGEVRMYMLPNSGLVLQLPRKLFIMSGCEEGIGFMPDYWLDSDQPVSEVVRWLKNPSGYRFVPASRPMLHDVDFEKFVGGIPQDMKTEIGATLGQAERNSMVAQDDKIFSEGKYSLRLSADSTTTRFYSLSMDVPEGLSRIRASYAVRGENLMVQGRQYGDSYLGFIYNDGAGNRRFETKDYRGTFDWRKDYVDLDVGSAQAHQITFTIFLAISGSLWVDDLEFETER